MRKTTMLLALLVGLAASSSFAKGGNGYNGGNCGGGGNPGGSVPDAASTMALTGVAIGALGASRRFFRR